MFDQGIFIQLLSNPFLSKTNEQHSTLYQSTSILFFLHLFLVNIITLWNVDTILFLQLSPVAEMKAIKNETEMKVLFIMNFYVSI